MGKTDPSPLHSSLNAVEIHLFGSPRIESGGRDLSVPRRKTIGIIAYLAAQSTRESRVGRDGLCGLMWPQLSQAGARRALRTTLTGLRRVLPEGMLETGRDWIALGSGSDGVTHSDEPTDGQTGHASSLLWIDLQEYRSLTASIRSEVLAGTKLPEPDECRAAKDAAELFTGDLLAGYFLRGSPEFDTWHYSESHRLQQVQSDLLWLLTQACIDGERPDEAIGWAQRLVSLDPLNEEVHREIMLLHHELGDRDSAIRQFDLCSRVLRTEMECGPEEQTVDLCKQIRSSSESRRRFSVPLAADDLTDPELTATSPDVAARNVPGVTSLDQTGAGGERIRAVTLAAAAIDLSDAELDIRDDQSLQAVEELKERVEQLAAGSGAALMSDTTDVVAVVFGAAVGHEDDPERGIAMADQMVTVARELGLGVSVAVRSGLVTVSGSHSRDSRLNVFGAPATLLTRQLARTPVGSVSLCGATYRMIAGVGMAQRADIALGDPVYLWSGWRVEKRQYQELPTRFVGRDTQVGQLLSLLRNNAAGTGGVAVVSGPAGIGKSAMMAEIKRRATDLHLRWFACTCVERYRREAYRPLWSVLKGLLEIVCERGWDDDLPAEAVRHMLARGALAPAHSTAVRGALERLLNRDGTASALKTGTVDGDQFTRDVTTAVHALLETVADEHLVIVVEDIHWADLQTAAVLLEMARTARRQPLSLVTTCRMGDIAGLEWLPDSLEQSGGPATVIFHLSPLSEREAHKVLHDVSGFTGGTELARQVLERAGGNPLFICELAALCRESDLVLSAIPLTIHLVVQRRLDAMPSELQLAMTAAAVLGMEVDAGLLAAVLERVLPGTDTESALARLTRSGALVGGGPGIAGNLEFTHALVQEAVYSTLKKQRLEQLHRASGEAIEQVYADGLGAWVPQLAFHWDGTKDDRKAAHYLESAGDRTREVFDLDAAIDLYGRAIERVEESCDPGTARRLNLKLATCHGLELRFLDEREAYRHAFALSDPPAATGPRDASLRIGVDFEQFRFGLHPICDCDLHHGPAIHRQIYRPLVRFTADLTPIPDAAELWEVSEDGMRYRFKIRSGISWSDGSPVTADDFIAAMEMRGVGKEHRGGGVHYCSDASNAGWTTEEGGHRRWRFRARAPDLVEIECGHPSPYTLRELGGSRSSSLPAHLLVRLGSHWHDYTRCAFSGPFLVASVVEGRSVTLETNPGYGDNFSGNLGRVDYLHADSGSSIGPFLDGTVDVLPNLTHRSVLQALEQCPDELVGVPGQSLGLVFFHGAHEMLQIPEMRQAFALAIDREHLCIDILGGFARAGNGGRILPGVQGHSPSGGFSFDPEKARELALRAVGKDELRSARFTVSVNERVADEGRFIAEGWERVLGVTVDLEVLDWMTSARRLTGSDPSDITIAHAGNVTMNPIRTLGNILMGPTGWTEFGKDFTAEAIASVPDGADAYLSTIRKLDLQKVHAAWTVPYCYLLDYTLQREWIRNLRWSPEGLMGLEDVVVMDH